MRNMRKWWAVVIMALLVVLAGCTEAPAPGVSSDAIPDPATQFLAIRNTIYDSVWDDMEHGRHVAAESRIAYALLAINSHAAGFESYDRFQQHLALIDYPEGVRLNAFEYRYKTIIVWLRRGEIDLATGDKMLRDLGDMRLRRTY